MSVQTKRVSTMGCVQKHLGGGQKKEKLNISKPKEDIDVIKLSKKLKKKTIQKEEDTSMLECHLKNKKETYKDKLNSSKEDIQIMKLSQILEADLTSKEKDSEKYWNNYSEEISKKLSYPKMIDLVGLEQKNSLYDCLNYSKENLQSLEKEYIQAQTKNCPTTYWKLLQSSPQDTTEEENITQITRKIRIYPNNKQRELFNKCFNAHNYFYNKAVESLKKDNKKKLIDFRKEFIPRDKEIKEEIKKGDKKNEWMVEIPLATREEATRKAIAALKTGMTQVNRKIIKNFKLKFRSKKKNTPVFYVAKKR